jgi:LemA protein
MEWKLLISTCKRKFYNPIAKELNVIKMRRGNSALYVILALVVILLFWGCSQQRVLVQQDENVKKTWNFVQSQYQRRADLIPNLVRTVQGEANFERGTLNDVINARARGHLHAGKPENLTPENIQRFRKRRASLPVP